MGGRVGKKCLPLRMTETCNTIPEPVKKDTSRRAKEPAMKPNCNPEKRGSFASAFSWPDGETGRKLPTLFVWLMSSLGGKLGPKLFASTSATLSAFSVPRWTASLTLPRCLEVDIFYPVFFLAPPVGRSWTDGSVIRLRRGERVWG